MIRWSEGHIRDIWMFIMGFAALVVDFFTFKSRTSVGVISDGSIKGVGLDDKAPLADGVGLTMPAHCGGSPT